MYISLVIKERQIKTIIKYHSQPSAKQKFKNVIIPSVGEDV